MNRLAIVAVTCFLSGAGVGWYFRQSQEKPPIPSDAIVFVQDQETKVSLVPEGRDMMDEIVAVKRLPNISRVSRAHITTSPVDTFRWPF